MHYEGEGYHIVLTYEKSYRSRKKYGRIKTEHFFKLKMPAKNCMLKNMQFCFVTCSCTSSALGWGAFNNLLRLIMF